MSARMDRLEFFREDVEVTEVDGDDVYIGVVPGDWRWRYVAANGNVLAVSSEGYRRRIDAVKAAARVLGINANRLATCCVPAATTEGAPHPVGRRNGEKLRIEVLR